MNVHKMKMEMAEEIEKFIDDKLAEFAAKTGLSCKVTAQTCTTPAYDGDDGHEFAVVDLRNAFSTWVHIEFASGAYGEFHSYRVQTIEKDNGVSPDGIELSRYRERKYASPKASPLPPTSVDSPSRL